MAMEIENRAGLSRFSYSRSVGASKASFSVGEIIHHRRFDYRGVIADVDPVFQGTEEWYDAMATSHPPKDAPGYHVLVHGSDHMTYVAERNLEADDDGVARRLRVLVYRGRGRRQRARGARPQRQPQRDRRRPARARGRRAGAARGGPRRVRPVQRDRARARAPRAARARGVSCRVGGPSPSSSLGFRRAYRGARCCGPCASAPSGCLDCSGFARRPRRASGSLRFARAGTSFNKLCFS